MINLQTEDLEQIGFWDAHFENDLIRYLYDQSGPFSQSEKVNRMVDWFLARCSRHDFMNKVKQFDRLIQDPTIQSHIEKLTEIQRGISERIQGEWHDMTKLVFDEMMQIMTKRPGISYILHLSLYSKMDSNPNIDLETLSLLSEFEETRKRMLERAREYFGHGDSELDNTGHGVHGGEIEIDKLRAFTHQVSQAWADLASKYDPNQNEAFKFLDANLVSFFETNVAVVGILTNFKTMIKYGMPFHPRYVFMQSMAKMERDGEASNPIYEVFKRRYVVLDWIRKFTEITLIAHGATIANQDPFFRDFEAAWSLISVSVSDLKFDSTFLILN